MRSYVLLQWHLKLTSVFFTAVSARARQLNHRLKNRRTAIVTRRENDASLKAHQPPQPHQLPQPQQPRSLSPIWRDATGAVPNPLNGNPPSNAHSPSTGFVAVNTSRMNPGEPPVEENALSSQFMFSHSHRQRYHHQWDVHQRRISYDTCRADEKVFHYARSASAQLRRVNRIS